MVNSNTLVTGSWDNKVVISKLSIENGKIILEELKIIADFSSYIQGIESFSILNIVTNDEITFLII